MKTVWKVFHGSRNKGYKIAYMKLADNGLLFGIHGQTDEFIVLNRAEIADMLLTLDKVVYGNVLQVDVKRIEEDEKAYREKKAQNQAKQNIVTERYDLTNN